MSTVRAITADELAQRLATGAVDVFEGGLAEWRESGRPLEQIAGAV